MPGSPPLRRRASRTSSRCPSRGTGATSSCQPNSNALTVRNIRASKRARLAFGATRDVVIVDAELEAALELEAVPLSLADAYARQAGWDPRRARGAYAFLVLRPRRIQAWREANELNGRTIMKDGAWLF